MFKKQKFSCYILLIDQVSFFGCPYLVSYYAIGVLQLFVTSRDVKNFEVNLIFLIKPFFVRGQNIKIKT